jgi:hypothetical protein
LVGADYAAPQDRRWVTAARWAHPTVPSGSAGPTISLLLLNAGDFGCIVIGLGVQSRPLTHDSSGGGSSDEKCIS